MFISKRELFQMIEEPEFSLTDKANFPENDSVASANLAIALGVVMDFLNDSIVDDSESEEVLNYWQIGRGFQAAAEMYFIRKAQGEEAI